MKSKFLALLSAQFSLFVLVRCQNGTEYCNVCPIHTMCVYMDVDQTCGEGSSGITAEEQREIVSMHNSLRTRVASGIEVRGSDGPQPSASNMRKLYWDDDLAEVAQRWADQCTFGHDACRDDVRFPVGQNVYQESGTFLIVNWTAAVQSWYDEVDLVNFTDVSSFTVKGIGHYTQVVWAETSLVGCGRREYYNSHIYVCNYGPAGNYLREGFYMQGAPCFNCPNETGCVNSLCARIGDRLYYD